MSKPRMSRRQFLGSVGGVTAAAFLSGNLSVESPFGNITAQAQPSAAKCVIDGNVIERTEAAYQIRETAALLEKERPRVVHTCNGDEAIYPNGEASFAKALPHNDLGEPDPAAYAALVAALTSGDPNDFRAIPMGGELPLWNPQAALAYDLEGPDSHQLSIRPAPAFTDAESAGEIVEVYWHALMRDVDFNDYDESDLARAAANELNNLTVFLGPRDMGPDRRDNNQRREGDRVTPRTLFRGNTPGDLAGPYVSQFLLQDVPYGAHPMEQRMRVPRRNDDFMTDFGEWLAVQRGNVTRENSYDNDLRYIRNGRDLGEFVHQDFPFQAYLNAALILFNNEYALDEANPYVGSQNQYGFVTFGISHVTYLVSSIANRALKAAWCQKWLVNRRLRPEVFGARIHQTKTANKGYLMHNDALVSDAVHRVFEQNGTYLLPQAYPEGSPTHPSYPAGHATMAGACVTMLKAFFDEGAAIKNPVRVTNNGRELSNYNGPPLTVGGELNKLAANISLGRDIAGVHYRSDGIEGMNLGEQLAMAVLEELRLTYNERFTGFEFTRFNGESVRI